MSNVVVVRLDLDRFDLHRLGELIRDDIIGVSDASETKVFKGLSEYQKLVQVRCWQRVRMREMVRIAM